MKRFDRKSSFQAFTLVELLVVITLIAVLAGLAMVGLGRVKDNALMLKEIAQLRQIGSSLMSRAQENQGVFYSKDEIGNSSYRVYEDKLSLPQVLIDYIPEENQNLWVSPKTHPRTVGYGNSFAWSRAKNVTETPFQQIANPANTLLLWYNYNYVTASPPNHVDPGASGGPVAANANLHYKPWRNETSLNSLFADGAVATAPTPNYKEK